MDLTGNHLERLKQFGIERVEYVVFPAFDVEFE